MLSKPLKTDTIASDMIPDVIHHSNCSTRLLNAITNNSTQLPVATVQAYMKNPDENRQDFLKLSGIDKISVMELDRIMREFKPDCAETPEDSSREEQACQDAGAVISRAIEVFCAEMQFPDDLQDFIPPGKLADILEDERKSGSISFFRFLETYDQIIKHLKSRKDCNFWRIAQLDKAVSRLLRTRLNFCGADIGMASDLRRFMRGDILSPSALEQLAELENRKDQGKNDTIQGVISVAMAGLPGKHHDILQRRYGIGQERVETLDEVSRDHETSRERIRQISNTIKEKLATPKTVARLAELLEQGDFLDRFFRNQKIVSPKKITAIARSFSPEERLAIDIAYGSTRLFLDALSVRTKAGWIRKQDISLLDHISDDISDTFWKRLKSTLQEQVLPLRLSVIASALPDYPVETIKLALSKNMGASFDEDIILAPRLPISMMCILILRVAGRALHFSRLQKEIRNIFEREVSDDVIKSILFNKSDFFIISRGTYDIIENIGLEQDDMVEIQNRAFDYLQSIGGFISVKTLFFRLFMKDKARFGNSFGFYLLLEILKRDKRFTTMPGLMVGTAAASEYKSLTEEIFEILANSEGMMTANEILFEIGDRRNIRSVSILNLLKGHPDIKQKMYSDRPGHPCYLFALATKGNERNEGDGNEGNEGKQNSVETEAEAG